MQKRLHEHIAVEEEYFRSMLKLSAYRCKMNQQPFRGCHCCQKFWNQILVKICQFLCGLYFYVLLILSLRLSIFRFWLLQCSNFEYYNKTFWYKVGLFALVLRSVLTERNSNWDCKTGMKTKQRLHALTTACLHIFYKNTSLRSETSFPRQLLFRTVLLFSHLCHHYPSIKSLLSI